MINFHPLGGQIRHCQLPSKQHLFANPWQQHHEFPRGLPSKYCPSLVIVWERNDCCQVAENFCLCLNFLFPGKFSFFFIRGQSFTKGLPDFFSLPFNFTTCFESEKPQMFKVRSSFSSSDHRKSRKAFDLWYFVIQAVLDWNLFIFSTKIHLNRCNFFQDGPNPSLFYCLYLSFYKN